MEQNKPQKFNSDRAISYLAGRVGELEKTIAVHLGLLVEKDNTIAELQKENEELKKSE